MTIISLADCCRLLASDPKTLRGWLALAHFPLRPHPSDARIKGIAAEQLRQIATAHRRTLADFPAAAPPLVPASEPQEPPLLSRDLIDMLQTIPELATQIVLLQQRLADLTQLLHLGVASVSQAEPAAGVGVSTPAPVSTAPRPLHASASSAKQRGTPAPVLPLVEYATHGGYVVICPEHGLLSFEPDTPPWFAWLATHSSFRFVGRHGRFTAHRELHRLPRAAWRAHRQIRNRTYNVRLGSTDSLTIAVLEQGAADLQTHLA